MKKVNFDIFPEISFIDNATLEGIQQELISDYSDKYEELTGDVPNISATNRDMSILNACAIQIYQTKGSVKLAKK